MQIGWTQLSSGSQVWRTQEPLTCRWLRWSLLIHLEWRALMEHRPPSICSHYPCNPISFSLSVSLSHLLSYFLAIIFTLTPGICLEWRHILTHSEWKSFWGFTYTRFTSLVPCWVILIVPLLSCPPSTGWHQDCSSTHTHHIMNTHSFMSVCIGMSCKTGMCLCLFWTALPVVFPQSYFAVYWENCMSPAFVHKLDQMYLLQQLQMSGLGKSMWT